MSYLTENQRRQIDADVEASLANPMPRDLREKIADHIEAHTIDMYLKHRDVMACIEYAYPLITRWLQEHG